MERSDFGIRRVPEEVDDALFWHVVEIWWTKPHCVNKRVCGADFPEVGKMEIEEEERRFLEKVEVEEQGAIEWRRMLPKNVERFGPVREVLIRDTHSCTAVFLPQPMDDEESGDGDLKSPHINTRYVISLVKDEYEKPSLILKVEPSKGSNNQSKWLEGTLMPTLVRWMNNCKVDKPLTHSLRLVDLETYNSCYNRLKTKYGKRLVEIWPERTDPKKFVYEDIATAAYLLTLWKEDREAGRCDRMQTFVDLGCGNGLLVYLLTEEGHTGYGIDLRKRHIWSMYGPNVSLLECAFEPSDQHLFPEADWIIGNHSDELTPWIPVIAAKCNFFVIPCCAWDFRGKYQRRDSDLSTYRSYLRYVKSIGERCGFSSEDDVLKIPSTKRACIVGRRNPQLAPSEVQARIKQLLGNPSKEDPSKADQTWIHGFEQREAKEPIRNCTTLPKRSIDGILKKITNKMLQEQRYVDVEDGRKWNRGGTLTLPECAQLMDDGDLKVMKDQCGGLQTLMKNHHQIFNVEKGQVSIRDWTKDWKKYRKNDKRPCWFYANHPDGCPLGSGDCPYAHVG